MLLRTENIIASTLINCMPAKRFMQIYTQPLKKMEHNPSRAGIIYCRYLILRTKKNAKNGVLGRRGMLHDELFRDIIRGVDGAFDEGHHSGVEVLSCMKKRYGLDNVAYLAINLPVVDGKEYIATTYSDEWVKRYVSQEYVRVDPVIQFGLRGILPVDWDDLPRASKKVVKLFGEAKEHGVSSQGLSIPVRGVHGETAMFSINIEMKRTEWLEFRKSIIRDLQIWAFHFHSRVLELQGIVQTEEIELSDREKECLKWASLGKSAWETGEIIGIQKRTVDFYLEQCRTKLRSVSTTQAVAKAVRMSLI